MAVVIAVDAGTTGVRSMAVGQDGVPIGTSYREFPQYFPRPGWVEHDPDEIWMAVVATHFCRAIEDCEFRSGNGRRRRIFALLRRHRGLN